MLELVIPPAFQDVLSSKCFEITDCDAVKNMSSDELEDKLERFIGQCSDGSFNCDDSMTNLLYSTIVNWSDIGDSNKNLFAKLVQSIASLSVLRMSESISAQEKRLIIVYLYFFQQFCLNAEKFAMNSSTTTTAKTVKGKSAKKGVDGSGFVWSEWRSLFLDLMCSVSSAQLNKLFPMGILQENFMLGFWSYSLKLLEDKPVGIGGIGKKEVESRRTCVNVISRVMVQFGSASNGSEALCAALVNALMKSEHMCGHLVELCCSNAGDFLTEVVIGEIGRLDAANLPATALKNIASFLDMFASTSPSTAIKYIPVLVFQLDSPAHQIRSSVVTCIAHIVSHIHKLVLQKAELKEEAAELEAAIERAAADDEQPFDINIQNSVQLTNIRDSLIDLVAERVRDSSPYTRSSVLKSWVLLLESGAVPVAKVCTVCEIAIDRLVDKNSLVRKHAAALLTACLDNNPFSGDLDLRLYSKQQQELRVQYTTRFEELKANVKPIDEPLEGEDPVDDEDNVELCGDLKSDTVILEIKTKLEVVSVIVRFIESINSAAQLLVDMLKSKLVSDVVEALQFYARAINFNVQGAMTGFKTAFTLVWHQEASIKTALLNSFVEVYFTDGASDNAVSLSPDEICFNLIKLLQSCNDYDVVSLEKVIAELINASKVDNKLFDAVWGRIVCFDTAQTNIVSEELGATLRLFCIIIRCSSTASTSLSAEKLQVILRVSGLDHISASLDMVALKSGIQCILTVPSFHSVTEEGKQSKDTLAVAAVKSVVVSAVPMLVKVILGDYCENNEVSTKSWFSACEEAIHAIYHIHSAADKVMSGVLHRMYYNLSKQLVSSKVNSSVFELSRFLFVLGQTALSTLVFTEALASKAKKLAPKTSESSNKSSETTAVDAMEEEMGCAAAADADHDKLLSEIMEREIVVKNMLGTFHPLLLFVVANERKQFSHPLIRQTAILSLCRFMATSSVVCESSLPLLFTVLESETSESIGTSVVITLGDLAFRFPNLIEPWTDRIYLRLRDENQAVRYNTLMVITNLVLNDMIKVKGQVSQVVISLNDPSEAIRELAKLFFIKLSERSNNPVYNILGDIIGNFSQEDTSTGSTGLTNDEFQSTMHFLLSFVEKDKQADSLLERLLARMALTQTLSHRRKLAFCISELNVTEKGVKKMLDLVKNIKDALFDTEIFDAFKSLLTKARKSSRGVGSTASTSEVKSAIDELDSFMDAVVNHCDEVGSSENADPNATTVDKVEGAESDPLVPVKKSAKKTVKKAPSSRKAKKVVESSEDEANFSEEEEVEVKSKAVSTSRRVKA